MQPSNNNGQAGHEELDEIQRERNRLTNASLERTRRMLHVLTEAQEIGNDTMVMLDERGEKLDQIEFGPDNIHHDMNKAEKHPTNLEKCFGLCVLPWQRAPRGYRPMSNSGTTYSSEKSSPTTTEPKLRMASVEGMPTSGYITRITNDDREEEMDDNLQLVGSHLGNLKNMALNMNDTITNQNKQFYRIRDKNEAGLDRVNTANKRTHNVL